MNPFERWDDWEWERAIKEVGKEKGMRSTDLRSGRSGHPRRPRKPGWGNVMNRWSGTQKRAALAVTLFLLIFFSANSSDHFSKTVHSLYQSAMNSSNYYDYLNGMAKEALSLGGVDVKNMPVDSKLKGQLLPPVSGKVVAAFGVVGDGVSNAKGSVHQGIDVESALGVQVVAPAASVVLSVSDDAQLGRIVKLDLGNGWTAVLGNLGDVFVVQGQRVEKGGALASVGLSAPLKKPWLHIELRKDDVPVNPMPYFTTSQT